MAPTTLDELIYEVSFTMELTGVTTGNMDSKKSEIEQQMADMFGVHTTKVEITIQQLRRKLMEVGHRALSSYSISVTISDISESTASSISTVLEGDDAESTLQRVLDDAGVSGATVSSVSDITTTGNYYVMSEQGDDCSETCAFNGASCLGSGHPFDDCGATLTNDVYYDRPCLDDAWILHSGGACFSSWEINGIANEACSYNSESRNAFCCFCGYEPTDDESECLQLYQFDTYSDGWNGFYFSLYQAEGSTMDPIQSVTLDDGSFGEVCLEVGYGSCYFFRVSQKGMWEEEITWSLCGITGNTETSISFCIDELGNCVTGSDTIEEMTATAIPSGSSMASLNDAMQQETSFLDIRLVLIFLICAVFALCCMQMCYCLRNTEVCHSLMPTLKSKGSSDKDISHKPRQSLFLSQLDNDDNTAENSKRLSGPVAQGKGKQRLYQISPFSTTIMPEKQINEDAKPELLPHTGKINEDAKPELSPHSIKIGLQADAIEKGDEKSSEEYRFQI